MEEVSSTVTRSTPVSKPRIGALDGIRALCAIGVVLAHVGWMGRLVGAGPDAPINPVAGFFVAGLEGVILGPFFVLSGMFLYRPFARAALLGTPLPKLGQFWLRRGARLIPAYWLVAAVSLLFLNFSSIHSAWYVLRPIVLMQSYDFEWIAGMDPLWTVPTEAQFYLVLPAIAWVMSRLAKTSTDPIKQIRRMQIPLWTLMLAGLSWTIYLHRPSMGPFPAQYWWPFWGLGLFGLGMMFTLWHVRAEIVPDRQPLVHRLARGGPNWFWLGALGIYLVNCSKPWGKAGYGDWETIPAGISQYVLSLVFAFVIVAPLAVPRATSRFQHALLGNPVAVYLGRISYGIYLWHFAVMYFYFKSGSIFGAPPLPAPFLRGQIGFFELVTAVLIGSIAIATVSWFALERPLLKLVGETKLKASPAPVAAATERPAPAAEEPGKAA